MRNILCEACPVVYMRNGLLITKRTSTIVKEHKLWTQLLNPVTLIAQVGNHNRKAINYLHKFCIFWDVTNNSVAR